MCVSVSSHRSVTSSARPPGSHFAEPSARVPLMPTFSSHSSENPDGADVGITMVA